jgi:hypothetical protein
VAHARAKPAVVAAAAAPVTTLAQSGRRTVCVRACDGFYFSFSPAEHSYDTATREAACKTACPDAETKLFVMSAGSEEISQAKEARQGELYAQYLARIKAGSPSTSTSTSTCGCHVASAAPTPDPRAALTDPTLRKGDMVVTAKGVRVYQGGQDRKREFLSLAETRGLTPSRRGALAAIDRMLKTPRHGPVTNPAGDARAH